MTPPVRPQDFPDADLYEHFRDHGMTHEQAVIHVERRRASKAPPPAPHPEMSGGQAGMIGAAQGATSGLADELIGAMRAIRDPNIPLNRAAIDSSIAATRQDFSEARSGHPVAALAGNVAGGVVNPLNKLLGPLTRGLKPAATGATYGAVLGGAQGAGEGEGAKERAVMGTLGAVVGGTLGLGGGFVAGKAAKPLAQIGRNLKEAWQSVRAVFQQTERRIAQVMGPKAAPAVVKDATEMAHRAYLQQQGWPPHAIDFLMEQWRAGGLPKNVPVPPPPPTSLRPGETLTPIAPKGFEVHGTRATPPVPTAPTILEMQTGQSSMVRQPGTTTMPDIGTGKTLPYWSRGGKVEQALGTPAPAQSASVPGAVNPVAQANIFAEFLKGANPADLANRIGTLRALGVPIGPAEEAQLVQMLTGGR